MRFLWYSFVNWLMSGVIAMFPFALLLGAGLIFGSASNTANGASSTDGFLLWAPFLLGSLAWGSALWHRHVGTRLNITDTPALIFASVGVAALYSHMNYLIVALADERGYVAFNEINYPGLVIFFAITSVLFFWVGMWSTRFNIWWYGKDVFWIDRIFFTKDEIDRYLRRVH
jgi:hypothetical protein